MRHISGVARFPHRMLGHRSRISSAKKAFARALRKNPSHAYQLVWHRLRGKKLGVRFRRRAVLFGWILDFWCPSRRVAVEIDYLSDAERQSEHRNRDQVLAERGIRVLRFSSKRIYAGVDQVAREIELVCQRRASL